MKVFQGFFVICAVGTKLQNAMRIKGDKDIPIELYGKFLSMKEAYNFQFPFIFPKTTLQMQTFLNRMKVKVLIPFPIVFPPQYAKDNDDFGRYFPHICMCIVICLWMCMCSHMAFACV